MVTYLVDTSVIARLDQPEVLKRVSQIGTFNCRIPVMVLLEFGVTARNNEEYERLMDRLQSAFAVVTASPWAQEWALEVQHQLVTRGQHRSARLGDLLIAATAQQIGATVLHYDRDFETLAWVTGQPCEWVAKPGSLDK